MRFWKNFGCICGWVYMRFWEKIRGCICGLEGTYATMVDESFGNSSENITNSIQCHKIASGGACGGLTIIYASKTRFRKVILGEEKFWGVYAVLKSRYIH